MKVMPSPDPSALERSDGDTVDVAETEPAPLLTFQIKSLSMWYGGKRGIENVSLDVVSRAVTAIIGPSGCGKSTFLRCLNRMHELVPRTRMEGEVLFKGKNLYASGGAPAGSRRRI